MTDSEIYTPGWRSAVRAGARSSAEVLAPLVTRFSPRSAIDVGCGEGWLGDELRRAGLEVMGVDGPWVPDAIHVDLSGPFYPAFGPFDVAVCLEVAEHVAGGSARALVGWLTELAPTVVFSAAVPGQGGEGHINEQPPTYWRDLFAEVGFAGSGALRWEIWEDDRVCWWYRQNLLVFGDLHGLPVDGCPHVVHPGMWEHRIGRR